MYYTGIDQHKLTSYLTTVDIGLPVPVERNHNGNPNWYYWLSLLNMQYV